MTLSRTLGDLANCFWLLVPILLFNLALARRLPAAYQPAIFWRNIPSAISLPESIFRALVMVLPVFMRLQLSTPSQKLGLGLYAAGLLIYFASWLVLIAVPHGAWAASAAGFLAPAYTPALWLAGIGLIGRELLIPGVPFQEGMYWGWMCWILCAVFLLFHNLHALTVFRRGL